MMQYITRSIKSPKDGSKSYYVQSAKRQTVDLNTLADRIEKRSTVSKADVKAVLSALEYEIIQALREGQTVRLGDIGTFYTSIKSQPAETQEEAWKKGANLIKHVSCNFLRSKVISNALQPGNLQFEPSEMEQARKEAARNAQPNP